MSILIRKEGILSTIQDLGRFGYQHLGINPGGAMDHRSVILLNILLGNPESTAVIEIHFPAGVIEFERPCIFALGGADFAAELNGLPVSTLCLYSAEEGDVLSFQTKLNGNRTYLAVRGGFSVEDWLGSTSTNLRAGIGGLNGRPLKTGDRIEFASKHSNHAAPSGTAVGPSLRRS